MHGLHRAAAFCKKEQLDKKKLNIACCMRTACDLLSFSCVEKRTECCSEIACSFGVLFFHVTLSTRSRPTPGEPRVRDLVLVVFLFFPCGYGQYLRQCFCLLRDWARCRAALKAKKKARARSSGCN